MAHRFLRPTLRGLALSCASWVLVCPCPASAASSAVERGDAVASADPDQEAWSIGSAGVRLNIGFSKDGTLVFHRLGDGGALLADTPDAPVVLGGQEFALGVRRQSGVGFSGGLVEEFDGGVRLTLAFSVPEANTRVLRRFAAYPGAPVVEMWFEFERLDPDEPAEASSIPLWHVAASARDVAWYRGLAVGEDPNVSFTRVERTLTPGDELTFGAAGRSTESSLPWLTARTSSGTLFAGLLWSGAWKVVAHGLASGFEARASIEAIYAEVPPGSSLEGPHGFVGLVTGGEPEIAAAMRTFLVDGLRRGRDFPALVTYNTWFVHGVRIDADIVGREVAQAASVGTELFQLDAGWYVGAGRRDVYDFTSGLGTWEVDEDKFPEGLRSVADQVHARGMKFGVWVEPERVDLAVVGTVAGPHEAWLARSAGRYRPGVADDQAASALLCLAHGEAWHWVRGHLTRLVREADVDYLKIDLNDWVNCTREGHGHGSRDGHFAHVKALYRLLAALRDEFPSLLIENCSGGGNRIDLGLARLTDAGWMDDRTTPSAHVRQNIQGLTAMLPPSYLLSYAMPSGAEFMSAAGDLPLLARSRMGGVLGMSYRDDELADADYTVLEREVEIYKRIRSLVPGRTAVLLTPQVTTDGPRPAWDTLEEASPDGTAAVVFACQNDGESGSTHVVPQRLAPEAMFEVVSIEGDRLAAGTGRALMAEGFILPASPSTTARVVLLVPAGTSSPVKSH